MVVENNRKALYLFAGLFNTIIGACGFLIGIVMLLMGNIVKGALIESDEFVKEFVDMLVEEDASTYAYLLDSTNAEVAEFVMSYFYLIVVAIVVIALVVIAFGVLNIILRVKHGEIFGRLPWLRHVFVTATWVFMIVNPINIVTTIAVYIGKKDNNQKEDRSKALYTANEEKEVL